MAFDNAGANDGFDVSEDSDGENINTSARQPKRMSGGLSGLKLDAEFETESKSIKSYPRKRRFPPGPLCSFQFLEEIESGQFDSPLWRRMKRRR